MMAQVGSPLVQGVRHPYAQDWSSWILTGPNLFKFDNDRSKIALARHPEVQDCSSWTVTGLRLFKLDTHIFMRKIA